LLLIVAAVVAMVFIPVWFIKPFDAQTERQIEISYLLKSWSPILTIVFALFAIGLAVFIWKNSKRWFGKSALIVPLLVIFGFTWFARQNHFEWMFNPLENTKFASVSETDFVKDDEMVLAVNINGDAVAFPVRQMAYHHIAQEVVGGMPITATY
jgi:phosphoglycerol transferase MdoB-like AlkP superfamily enzyme